MFNSIKKFLSSDDLKELEAKITETEKLTSGEIRICLRTKRNSKDKAKSSFDLAVEEFHKLNMHQTKDKSGILLFVNFRDRKLEIVADEGIHKKLSQDFWDNLAKKISGEFASQNFKQGILHFLAEAGNVLAEKFPRKNDDANELSDSIVVE